MGFKGHKARKQLKEQKATTDIEEEESAAEEETKAKEVEEATEDTAAEDDEVIDIDLTDPDVEAAATKIQAGFKGHKTRKDMKKSQLTSNAAVPETGPDKVGEVDKEQDENAKDKSEKEETEEEVIDIDLNDPEVEAAATKIQAGFKGHKARKEVSKLKEDQTGSPVEEKPKQEETETPKDKVADEEEVDID